MEFVFATSLNIHGIKTKPFKWTYSTTVQWNKLANTMQENTNNTPNMKLAILVCLFVLNGGERIREKCCIFLCALCLLPFSRFSLCTMHPFKLFQNLVQQNVQCVSVYFCFGMPFSVTIIMLSIPVIGNHSYPKITHTTEIKPRQ